MSDIVEELTKLKAWCEERAAHADQQSKRLPWDQPRLRWQGRAIAYTRLAHKIYDRIFELSTGIEFDRDTEDEESS